MTERRAVWPGVEPVGVAPDDGGPACRLLAALPAALAELGMRSREYSFEVGDIRVAFPKCPLGNEDYVVYVYELVVWGRRNEGRGRRIMGVLTRLADEHSVTIVLVPTAMDYRVSGLGQADLVAWYGRLGFTQWYAANMIRRPSDGFTRPGWSSTS